MIYFSIRSNATFFFLRRRQEIDEKDERRMMIKIENDDVDFEDEADDASLESTGMDEEDSDDDYVNQFTVIYPSHRNKEEDYEKYF